MRSPAARRRFRSRAAAPVVIAAVLRATVVAAVLLPTSLFGGLTVYLADGTQVSIAQIHGIDAAGLTILAAAPGIEITRTLPWSLVTAAEVEGTRYSPQELQRAAGVPAEPQPIAPRPTLPCDTLPLAWQVPYPRLLPRGVVVGVRPDPLAAYADLIPSSYPAGIPATEAGFALAVLRERRALDVLSAAGGGSGPFVPPGRVPAASPFPAGRVPAGSFSPSFPLPVGPLPRVPVGPLSRVEVQAVPVRHGGGADVNALQVQLLGFDAAGQPVPVVGTATLTLDVPRAQQVLIPDNVYGPRFGRLTSPTTWTRTLGATPTAAWVLPLTSPLPEHNPRVGPVGTLRAQVLVPGSGVYAAVSEPIALRPASPFRDAVRQQTGSRFLPSEVTTGRPTNTFPRQRGFSAVLPSDVP